MQLYEYGKITRGFSTGWPIPGWINLSYDNVVQASNDQVEELAKGNNVLLGLNTNAYSGPFTPGLYLENKAAIKDMFTFKPEIEQAAHKYLKKSLDDWVGNRTVLVGVHVRRTDYSAFLRKHRYQAHIPSAEFYRAAMDRFRSKFGPSNRFLMASDDPDWVSKYFEQMSDVHIVSGSNEYPDIAPLAFDLAVLTKCNHSIYG